MAGMVIALAGCGKEKCYMIGPFGDCDEKNPPRPDDANNRGINNNGNLQITADVRNLVVGPDMRVRITASGGKPPYNYFDPNGSKGRFEPGLRDAPQRFFTVSRDVGNNERIDFDVEDSNRPPQRASVHLTVVK